MPQDMTDGFLGITVQDRHNRTAATGQAGQANRLVSPSPELRRLLAEPGTEAEASARPEERP